MNTNKRLFELEQKYDVCLSDITELQTKLEQEEIKLFKCREEIREIKEVVSI